MFKFVIHFIKLKAIPLCYIYICHTFPEAEGYTTLLYLVSPTFPEAEGDTTLLHLNLSYFSNDLQIVWIA